MPIMVVDDIRQRPKAPIMIEASPRFTFQRHAAHSYPSLAEPYQVKSIEPGSSAAASGSSRRLSIVINSCHCVDEVSPDSAGSRWPDNHRAMSGGTRFHSSENGTCPQTLNLYFNDETNLYCLLGVNLKVRGGSLRVPS